jgi:hypothetical protein
MTFTNKKYRDFTLSYNTLLRKMISFHDFKPSIYIAYRGLLYYNKLDKIYNLMYDRAEDNEMSVTLLNTDGRIYIKLYDNIEIDSNVKFDRIECKNSYQTSGVLPFKSTQKVLRQRLTVPREENSMIRLRDDHLFVKVATNTIKPINFEYLLLTYNIAKTTYAQTK